jgi:hypothetical protein
VRTTSTPVLSTHLYELYDGGTYPEVAVIALLMVATTAVGAAATIALGGRSPADTRRPRRRLWKRPPAGSTTARSVEG